MSEYIAQLIIAINMSKSPVILGLIPSENIMITTPINDIPNPTIKFFVIFSSWVKKCAIIAVIIGNYATINPTFDAYVIFNPVFSNIK